MCSDVNLAEKEYRGRASLLHEDDSVLHSMECNADWGWAMSGGRLRLGGSRLRSIDVAAFGSSVCRHDDMSLAVPLEANSMPSE
jgi:hypothetical protein